MPDQVLTSGSVFRRPETLYQALQKNSVTIAGGALGAAVGGLSGGGVNRAIEFGKVGSNIGSNVQQILKEEHIRGKAEPASVDPNTVPGMNNPTALKQETPQVEEPKVNSNDDWEKKGGCPCCGN